jgi:hypothetical protein
MKSLRNEYVEHIKYGRGLIIDEETGRVTVEFDSLSGIKKFQFPDSFEQFLTFEDKSLQEDSLRLIDTKKQQVVEEYEKKRLELERQEEERKIEELELKKQRKIAKRKDAKVVK